MVSIFVRLDEKVLRYAGKCAEEVRFIPPIEHLITMGQTQGHPKGAPFIYQNAVLMRLMSIIMRQTRL